MADDHHRADDVSSLAPVSPEERYPVLDVLRGFALLGIIVMNLPGFSLPVGLWALDERYFPSMYDRVAETVANIIFAGKANSIFSFLFALGLTIQMQRAEAAGQRLTPTYLRRIAILFVVGVAHGIFVWNGDVLHMYAVLGLVLLVLRNASDRVLFGIMAFGLVAPSLRGVVALLIDEPRLHPKSFWIPIAHEHMRIFREGTYLEQIQARLFLYKDMYVTAPSRGWGAPWDYLIFLLTMLLGLFVGRKRWLENIPANASRIKKLMWIGLGVGLVASATAFILIATIQFPVPTERTWRQVIIGVLFNVNRPLLCMGYIGAIALLLQRERFQKVLLVFAAPGRMAFTNYLMQSLIATTLFNSYGFGLFGKVGPLAGLGIAVAIFIFQIFWSRFWLARVRFGPLEWLWRAATYGKLPSMSLQAPKSPPELDGKSSTASA
jgi:uncharacterized protein